jgi:hypothetical protein
MTNQRPRQHIEAAEACGISLLQSTPQEERQSVWNRISSGFTTLFAITLAQDVVSGKSSDSHQK